MRAGARSVERVRIRGVRLAACGALVLLLLTTSAFAQDEPRIGITMAYPTTVGLLWQVSERIAVRPDVAFSTTTGESSTSNSFGATPTSIDGSSVSVGLSALLTVRRWDNVRAYVSPRVEYARNTSTLAFGTTTSNSKGTAYVTSVAFGAQYVPVRRFGVYGEVGLAYTRGTNTSALTQARGVSRTTTQGVGLRSGAGVMFFF